MGERTGAVIAKIEYFRDGQDIIGYPAYFLTIKR